MTKELWAWEEKYQPNTVADVILPEPLKAKFQSYVDAGEIPNLLLAGEPGVGKTTVAAAMLKQLGCTYIIKNASMEGNIDTLRSDITQFASTVSLMGGRKYVLLDEADYANRESFQPALRAFMVDYKNNCGFILTCNWKSKIIDPLISRLSVIDFKIETKYRVKMLMGYLKAAQEVLTKEGIEFEPDIIAKVVDRFYPDFRKVLIELQAYAMKNGKIDVGILSLARNDNMTELLDAMKSKSYSKVLEWVTQNGDNGIFRELYDCAKSYWKPNYVPQMVLTTARYQHMATQCVDEEINIVAYLTEVMAEAEWL